MTPDDKGYSTETCIRCGWVMGQPPLNCQNDDTPHVFPSQDALVAERDEARREADSWREAADPEHDPDRCTANYRRLMDERDAATARVAELEKALRAHSLSLRRMAEHAENHTIKCSDVAMSSWADALDAALAPKDET